MKLPFNVEMPKKIWIISLFLPFAGFLLSCSVPAKDNDVASGLGATVAVSTQYDKDSLTVLLEIDSTIDISEAVVTFDIPQHIKIVDADGRGLFEDALHDPRGRLHTWSASSANGDVRGYLILEIEQPTDEMSIISLLNVELKITDKYTVSFDDVLPIQVGSEKTQDATTSTPTPTPTPASASVPPTTPSSSGGKIAFASYREGNYGIYVMNSDGSNQTRLTSDRLITGEPAWSPDSKKIAFVSYRDGDQEIYVMDADGGNQTQLTNNDCSDNGPVWSPDGSKIAFASRRKYDDGGIDEGIYIMNSDGSNQNRLTKHLGDNWGPAWSPNGEKIAFSSYRDNKYAIYVMNADGSNQVRLSDKARGDSQPSWSPNGSEIAFSSYRDGNWEIYIMNSDGTNQMRLTSNSGKNMHPDWSPDGKKIAFWATRDEVWVMNADGSNQKKLADGKEPAWSPQ